MGDAIATANTGQIVRAGLTPGQSVIDEPIAVVVHAIANLRPRIQGTAIAPTGVRLARTETQTNPYLIFLSTRLLLSFISRKTITGTRHRDTGKALGRAIHSIGGKALIPTGTIGLLTMGSAVVSISYPHADPATTLEVFDARITKRVLARETKEETVLVKSFMAIFDYALGHRARSITGSAPIGKKSLARLRATTAMMESRIFSCFVFEVLVDESIAVVVLIITDFNRGFVYGANPTGTSLTESFSLTDTKPILQNTVFCYRETFIDSAIAVVIQAIAKFIHGLIRITFAPSSLWIADLHALTNARVILIGTWFEKTFTPGATIAGVVVRETPTCTALLFGTGVAFRAFHKRAIHRAVVTPADINASPSVTLEITGTR
jgi:hypothetical protein